MTRQKLFRGPHAERHSVVNYYSPIALLTTD